MNPNGRRPSLSRAIANGVGRIMTPAQFRGKVRLTNWMGGIASRFTSDADCHPVKGARVIVSLNDRIGRMMWMGCYELGLVALLSKILRPGMTFVDVGAQVGYFSIMAAALVGPAGGVHSFEPDSDCFSRLLQNSLTYPWVKVHNSAVADITGETSFYRSPKRGESGWGAIFDEDIGRTRVSVGVCTLDSWKAAEGIEKIDVIKIDVEGAECRVIEGARAVIAKARPIMWVEVNELCLSRDRKSVSSLLGLLAGWDYASHGVCERQSQSFENIVAIPCERADQFEQLGCERFHLRAISGNANDGDCIPL
jgi:FkbM family methyltransferase